jgi:hypothetical protein
MAPDYIKIIAERWVFDLIDFAENVLMEEDTTHIHNAVFSIINSDCHCALQDVAESTVALGWIREFQKFKYSYALYPNKLNNLLIIAVYMHCRNIETAEYIIRAHLYRNGHSIYSDILRKNILIDRKFIERVNEFYQRWNDVER